MIADQFIALFALFAFAALLCEAFRGGHPAASLAAAVLPAAAVVALGLALLALVLGV